MTLTNTIKRRWKAKTPKMAKAVGTFSAFGVVAIPVLASGVTGLTTPQLFVDYGWYGFSFCTAVTLWCKTREESKNPKKEE